MLALRSWTMLVHQLRDEAGRPLGEHRVPGASAAVPMELAACPYHDSRAGSGKPVNLSALRETMKHWRAAVGLLARAHSEAGVTTAMDVWWAGQIAEGLPYRMLFANGGRIDGVVVPGLVAAAYKAMLGTNAALLGFVLDRFPVPRTPPTVDEVLAHVEKHRLLVGPEQACAGPEAFIHETLSVLIHGGAHSGEADRLFDTDPDAVALGRARASLLLARLAFGLTTYAIFSDFAHEVSGDLRRAAQRAGGEPTRDQERFAAAAHDDRIARLRALVERAGGSTAFLEACERALLLEDGRTPLDRAKARQELVEDACRTWIAENKARIRALLPEDPVRDAELGLSAVSLPSQTPLRQLDAILSEAR